MVETGKKKCLDERFGSRVIDRSLYLPVQVRAVSIPLREDIKERFGKEGAEGTGASPLRGEVEGTGLVQPEKEKAARGPYKCLQISEGWVSGGWGQALFSGAQ